MKVDIFDFALPNELIATQPANPRDSSRLLDLSVEDKITDRHFYDLPNLLNKGDLLVFNDTKVIPAKLYASRGEAEVEITLYRPVDALNWWSFIKNAKRLKEGDIITFHNNGKNDFSANVIEKKGEEGILLQFNCKAEELPIKLEEYGSMPLPPYIKRKQTDNNNDKETYQTVYAKNEGAVAAPTAGLHFTKEILEKIKDLGINTAFVTLHVGAGTFLPVKVEDTKDHKMHFEYGIISKETADLINQTKKNGGRIISVGTTSLRLLESATDDHGTVHPFADETGIFITPGYKFRVIDMIITNFHLPKSTLFMLVSSIAGIDRMQQAYQHAIEHKYRFYSYGDSSIIKVNKN